MAEIDEATRELLNAKNFATVTTLNEDGTPHNVHVWVDVDDGTVVLNSAKGRKWPTNAERDPRIGVLVANASDPYEYVEIRGRAEMSTDDADEVIDALAKKYIGEDRYPFRQPGEQRVTLRVTPERVRYQKQG
jgi:PPOX class probable F420-dependent enzyme